jgi:hypothetical protein
MVSFKAWVLFNPIFRGRRFLGRVYSRQLIGGFMDAWHQVRALPASDRRLLTEAAALLFLVSLGASTLPFPTLRRLLHLYGRSRRGQADELSRLEIRRIVWAVTAAARRLPLRSTCLVEALAAEAMLARRGCACDLRFGVRTTDEVYQGSSPASRAAAGRLTAHAWIEHRGVVILGQLESLNDYSVLSGPGGA